MAHLDALKRDRLAAIEPVLAGSEAMMGFVPNSMLTMSHMPQLTMAFSMLAGVVFGRDLADTMAAYRDLVPADEHAEDALPPDLIQLVAYAVSVSAGCRYCQAHTSHNATRFGASEDKLLAVLDYESSSLFAPAERAAIGLALAAGQVPNEVDRNHFEALQQHFNERQIVQIVAVVSLFGFLNRWNDTLATDLETQPTAFAESTLAKGGWRLGKHAGGA